MKIRVGIVGYGNLGKAVENVVKKDDKFELVGVFSKRKLRGIISVDDVENFKDKIDLLFLCGGSQNELEDQAFRFIKNFNIIESYDNHNRLKEYHKRLGVEAQKNEKIALCSFGWDPGLFSFMRGLFAMIGYEPYTFWGKGLSQGHTQAIKNIPGVIDAAQFTIPNKKVVKKICGGSDVSVTKNFHSRECFVVCDKGQRERIKKEIVSMPDYFYGYKTSVKFVSKQKLDRIKNFAHQGIVLTKGSVMRFALKLPSNPEFTARVVVCFAKALETLKNENKFGVHSIFDIPLRYVMGENVYQFL